MEIPIPTEFTLEELLELLESQEGKELPDGYLTTLEWKEYFNISILRVRQLLRKAKAAGVLLIAKLPRENIMGSMQPRPVYKFDISKKKGGNENG